MKNETNDLVFVYGTLMHGERANTYLRDAEFAGDAVLRGYAMYDLGSYPGIAASAGEAVVGELYRIDREMLRQMDAYEGEGSLYRRDVVRVTASDGKTEEAFVYVYARSVEGRPIVRSRWNMKDSDPVWYAAYGSNLCSERFEYYIAGGVCPINGKPYKGCRDQTSWAKSLVRTVPGRMYFGNSSPSWGDHGVSFYAPEAEGETVMRLYRITFGQLKDIQRQEGDSDRWYGRLVFIGFEEGLPAYTFTSGNTCSVNAPCEAYYDLIFDALVKECGLFPGDARSYLRLCRKPLPSAESRASGSDPGQSTFCPDNGTASME